MSCEWPRGSEWRLWDLHVHAPGTKLNDQFADDGSVWEDYCRLIEDSEVQAVGITDYFSADTYFKAAAEFESQFPKSSKLLLANVELRTTDVVNKAQEEVNLHLIFNPDQDDHDEKVRTFLSHLKTSKTEGGGREIKASELEARDDFEEATTTRDFIRQALAETYGRDADLLEYVLVVTSANNDGIRAERGKKRKALITDELDKFSDAFFGNAGNTDYFLDTGRYEGSEEAERKPVLSGSDAHSLTDLQERLGRVADADTGIAHQPTWIKADLTYEGLKQIVFEPADRVFIGQEPEVLRRVREHKTRYIESVSITAVDGYRPEQCGSWFQQEEVPLNKELVAIIGNKGSGKSAITDIIGLLGNSHNQSTSPGDGSRPEELFSFLNREKFLKGGCASHFVGTLRWYDGEPDEGNLGGKVTTHAPEKVEYLPQKYLERICANIEDDEFRETLNSVIFQYVRRKDQYERENLTDLIAYLTRQAEEDIANAKLDLHDANVAVVALERKLTQDHRDDLEERFRLKKEELAAHDSEKPPEKEPPTATEQDEASSAEVEDLSEQVTNLDEQIDQRRAEQVAITQVSTDLVQARTAIERQVAALEELRTKHSVALEAADLSFDDIVQISVNYAALDSAVETREARDREIDLLLASREEVEALGLNADAETAAVEASLVCQRASLVARRAELVERLDRPQREYQEYLRSLEAWTQREKELRGDEGSPATGTFRWLENEIARLGEGYPEELAVVRSERAAKAKAIFDKKLGLTGFYADVKEAIDREIAKCRDDLGEYDIAIEASLRFQPTFYEGFLEHINQTPVGTYRGLDDGRDRLREFLDPVTDWQSETQVFEAVERIVEALHTDRRPDISPPNQPRDVFKQMAGQGPVEDLYDYLFGFEYLQPKYDLTVDEKDLSELSPGERGGLLLIFYLMLDRRELPLVIDQPEDNLDNKSVYEILVKFIKQAKKRRQIILVTHNPNLAVVADAEQIIHVSLNKQDRRNDFDFFAGSIECPKINRTVVDILEGTWPAFHNRRLKYGNE